MTHTRAYYPWQALKWTVGLSAVVYIALNLDGWIEAIHNWHPGLGQ